MTSLQLQFLADIKTPLLRRYLKRPWELSRRAERFIEEARERERNSCADDLNDGVGCEEALNLESVETELARLTPEEQYALHGILNELFH